MAARATRSASHARAALSERIREAEAEATGPLGALSHDELGVIFDGLADPLQPVVAVALSSTCLGLRTPLGAALEVLKERHARAVALCCKVQTSCAKMRDAAIVDGYGIGLTADDMATFAMILRTNGLPRLQKLLFGQRNLFGDAGVQALCEGLGRGAAPSLRILTLNHTKFGTAGAEALAAGLLRGAMPKLENLHIQGNPGIGNQGMTALAAPLRKLPALRELLLGNTELGDEGVASLFDDLGKDDFKALERLCLLKTSNALTDKGYATLASALTRGAMPRLTRHGLAVGPEKRAAFDLLLEQRGR